MLKEGIVDYRKYESVVVSMEDKYIITKTGEQNHSWMGQPHLMEEQHRVADQTLCDEGITCCGDGRDCKGERHQ